MHKAETLGNHVVELVVPFFIFLPRPFRLICGALQILFQVSLHVERSYVATMTDSIGGSNLGNLGVSVHKYQCAANLLLVPSACMYRTSGFHTEVGKGSPRGK